MRVAVLLVGLSALAAAPSVAGENLTKKERSALLRVERALFGLSQYAARARNWPGAIDELRFILEAWPDSANAPPQLARVRAAAAKGGRPRADHATKMAKKRDAAYAKVAMALANAALAIRDRSPRRFQRYVQLIQRRCPVKKALDKLDLAYFAPYYSYFPKEAVALLEKGSERINGVWVDAAEVVKRNRTRSEWRKPWVIADDVHEVRTTLPYRKAMQVLSYVGHYRRWFLDQFAGSWDLQPPTGKLPVIVTQTRQEMEARMQEATKGGPAPPRRAAAFYLQTNGRLNPCFVSYEIVAENGPSVTVETFEELLIPLTHEITHQICFEYSKHDYNDARKVTHEFWSVEAFANNLGYYEFDGHNWRLTKAQQIKGSGGYYSEGPFYWCQENLAKLPTLAEYFRIPRERFSTVENYHIGATLSHFLLDGADGKYRDGYLKLLEAVHKVKDTADLWKRCFPGIDMAALNAEFVAFVAKIELDK
jgi:hypothetical protein